MKLETQITFTPYTIDTYSMFGLDCEDALIDDGKVYDDYDWTYLHKKYVQALADNWLLLMRENIIDDVVLDIAIVGEAYSPREYNFTTDNCQVSFDVDIDKLRAYVEAHRAQYDIEHIRDHDGFWWFGNEDDTMLHWYLQTVSATQYTPDTYVQDQYEGVPQYEYVECTPIVPDTATA